MRVSIIPFEANSPLIIDSYAALAFSVGSQFLQSVGILYYSSTDDDEVRACPLPGLCPIDFTSRIFMDAVNSGLVFPNGLFVDHIADHLYLSDSSNRIMRCAISATTPCGTVASELTIFANAATSGLNSPQFVWGY